MNIFFDVDYTLLGVDGSLRPNAREVLQRLKDDGHTLYVWSGNGIRRRDIQRHGLDALVTDCFEKPLDRIPERLDEFGLTEKPDMVVDDHLEAVAALGGIWVRPYYFPWDGDDEMEHVYRIVAEASETGRSADPRFRAPPPRL